jgi:hypothetical protein
MPPASAFAGDPAQVVRAAALPAEVRLTSADPDEALRLLYLRLESLHEAGLGWDEPPAVLGAEPATALTAPTRGWVRVRAER